MARLRRLKNDSRSLSEAAKTICLAFADDPLIKWLRPDAPSWGRLESSSLEWQRRRIWRANCDGIVMYLDPQADTFEVESKATTKPISLTTHADYNDFDAIVILEPPKNFRTFSVHRQFLRLKLWYFDKFYPAPTDGGRVARIESMMEVHEREMAQLRKELQPEYPWYLEVIAIRPQLHGLGIGGQMMQAVLEITGKRPVVLECTDFKNTGFYERYGFEHLKTLKLDDTTSSSKETKFLQSLMIRRKL